MSFHTFSPPSDGSISPAAWYQAMRDKPGFILDESQAAAIRELEALWHELIRFKEKRNQFMGRGLLSPKVPKGIYFWGGVGRGKSFLMDMFFACVPYKRKRRIHFHDFMLEAHHKMKLLASARDPLLALADDIAKTTRLLCFDEFHVSDIADAMILGRLMAALFERGVVMLITSNSSPENLYPNGLQRQKFLPAIELLKRNLKVINIDNGNDYRLRAMPGAPLFMLATEAESESRMLALFQRLAAGTEQAATEIAIQGRAIKIRKLSAHAAWFDFSALCGGPRAQADYLEIARRFPVIFISDIPLLTANEAAQTQRFIWLVDVLYDNRVKLVATSKVAIRELCSSAAQLDEFARIVSRLTEMQSQRYLELKHQAEITQVRIDSPAT